MNGRVHWKNLVIQAKGQKVAEGEERRSVAGERFVSSESGARLCHLLCGDSEFPAILHKGIPL